ncbi:MAG: cellulase-like family protein, partial [Bacteroidota bacterium]
GEEGWYTDASMKWMQEAAGVFKQAFPDLPVTFSFKSNHQLCEKDLSFLDLLEPHIWMAKSNNEEFYRETGYNYPSNNPVGFERMVDKAESLYLSRKEYWNKLLKDDIIETARIAKEKNLPLVTTECWAVVDYKDWPLLNWEWVKELCEFGVDIAIYSRAWMAIATSNFCGPQFSGMWRDIEWHNRLTSKIKTSFLS